jgi:uncharacterized protein GlcG (DUF336 family)
MSSSGNSKSNTRNSLTGRRRRGSKLAIRVEPLEGRCLMTTPGFTPNQTALVSGAAAAILPPNATTQQQIDYINAVTNYANDPAESPAIVAATTQNQLTPTEVETLLDRASAATPDQTAIIAIVDRGGRVLGVRADANVSPAIMNNTSNLVFAVDGALALARTGAFFGNNQAPLTSRTIQNLSETTVTQRETDSNPSIADPNSTLKGPGTVAPVGIKGHFPSGIPFTPQVDLLGIEFTNRDTTTKQVTDPTTGAVTTITLPNRFNVPDQFIPSNIYNPSQGIDNRLTPPDSYGFISGLEPNAQPRGIGTLPGGLPIVKVVKVNGVKKTIILGGIGVFYPGTTGFATAENSVLNDAGFDPTKPDKSSEAEAVAFAALGGATGAALVTGVPTTVGALGGVPPVPGLDLLPSFTNGPNGKYNGRIDLVGITLDVFGPHGNQGPASLLNTAKAFGVGTGTVNGIDLPISPSQPPPATLIPPNPPVSSIPNTPETQSGRIVPNGWLVTPHAGGNLTAADVIKIVADGVGRAEQTRAAIRLPINRITRMVFAVSDEAGNILGLYRMPDATIFSIDVAVAKARNVAYYNDANQLQPQDQVKGVAPGTALTARTFRYLTLPHFPEGQDNYPAGPFSILNDGGTTFAAQGATIGAPLPASAFQSVQGFDAFNPGTNFHAKTNPANQNGVVFFPGSSGLYKPINGVSTLVGGLGVSGDGVDQDDVITYSASLGFRPGTGVTRADMVKVRGVRLPYTKFNRQPEI